MHRFPPSLCFHISTRLTALLDRALARGVVHRPLTPSDYHCNETPSRHRDIIYTAGILSAGREVKEGFLFLYIYAWMAGAFAQALWCYFFRSYIYFGTRYYTDYVYIIQTSVCTSQNYTIPCKLPRQTRASGNIHGVDSAVLRERECIPTLE